MDTIVRSGIVLHILTLFYTFVCVIMWMLNVTFTGEQQR